MLEAPSAVRAQLDARSVLMQMILQLQTGTPNPTWYGAQLWQTMAVQTRGTGIYIPLVQLGRVQSVTINEELPLPTGNLYSMTANHQNGTSTWLLGISSITWRIEYADFLVGAAPQALPQPAPLPPPRQRTPSPEPPANPSPVPAPGPDSPSPACKKFPNLC